VRPDDLGAIVIKALIDRNPNLDVNEIEDVIFVLLTKPVRTIEM
jgi:3-oxo-5,6-didehydrosuberyl-CoA/3-oxoadipyl-CoA thiolase